ncbi:MAG: phosphoribosylformylglycinamidine synthase I [Candidatus Omnitrophica bacterium]|jgi:phosphoribosylformylglycinamidine synthase|nr:phosphoribosylformylglycinamidine synthase I [Candidatus Omnitrophota bacterium]
MKKVLTCVLRTAGTNCDKETAFAFKKAGASVELVHINQFACGKVKLGKYKILALPGGFSYGDDVAAGKILANELKYKLRDSLREFVRQNKLVIGICNGFQVLVKAGLLPGNKEFKQEVSLILNDSGKFEDRWVYLKSKKEKVKSQKCVWTKDLPEVIYLPVAHAEGKFVVKSPSLLKRLKENGQIVLRYSDSYGNLTGYPDNPNGSQDHIAGICDESGCVFGLMPHPERHIDFLQHPNHKKSGNKSKFAEGMQIFVNAVGHARKV